MEHRIPLNKGEILDPCMGSVCDQVNLQKCFPKIICSVWGQSLSTFTVTYRAPMLQTWKYLSTASLALPFSLKTNTLIFRHENLMHFLNRSPGA